MLDAEHAEGEAQPRRDPSILATHPVVEERRDDQAEVSLGLASAGREPQDVNKVELFTHLSVVELAGGECREVRDDVNKLE